MKRPLLLGHRGCRGCGFVENSLAAFEHAITQGCDGFELDVRQTRDGRNVVRHDAGLSGRPIAESDYADLVHRSGDALTTLEEVVPRFRLRGYLDIELKAAGFEEAIVTCIKANPPQQGFVISSFYSDILVRLHDLDSGLPLGFLCERREHIAAWRDLPVRTFLPRYDLIGASLIEEVHDASLRIMTWTVNSSRHMRRLADWGIDGLISDDPRLLYQTFHNG